MKNHTSWFYFSIYTLFICSAYLFARMRLFPRRDLDIENDIDRKKGKYEHNNELEISPSCSNYPTEQFDDQNLSSFSHLKDSVIIRNITNETTETDVRNVGLIEESTSSELIFWYQVISNLTTKAGLSTNTTYSTSRKRRSRLLSFSKHPKLTTDYLLQLLVSYSKDQKFLNLLYESEHFEKLIDWLGVISLNALNKSDINVSVVEKYNDPPSSEKSNSSFTVIDNVPSAHPEYPIHVLVANFLANISQHPSSCIFKNLENMNKLLALWEISPSLHLNLLGAKIDHNLKVHSRLSDKSSSTFQKEINQQSCNSPNSLPIYCPDVYKLNISK
ncbi:unnamed protein product [Heterobilharzia americana]|nr:unnamed protein product [Heterobilharzia americana]